MANRLEDLIKVALQKRGEFMSHRMSRLRAESLLKSIESEKGKTNPHFSKLSLEYAQDVFGNKWFAPWLNVYAALSGQFKEGWIPENYYAAIVIPYIQGLYGNISNAKPLSKTLLKTSCLPDLAYFVNGLFFTSAWEVLVPDAVENYVFNNNKKIVYKQDNSNKGLGVYIFSKDMFDMDTIRKMGNGVFQRYIKQHRFFEEIMPGAVATLRITSVIEDNGKASCRGAYLRIGRKEDTHVRSGSAIKIPVDLKSGTLSEKGYMVNWQTTSCHPDTGILFEGKIIPKFDDCIAYVEKTHQQIPFCRLVGWDIIVNDNEEVEQIEWNGSFNDIIFSEATQGPCFSNMGWEKIWKR